MTQDKLESLYIPDNVITASIGALEWKHFQKEGVFGYELNIDGFEDTKRDFFLDCLDRSAIKANCTVSSKGHNVIRVSGDDALKIYQCIQLQKQVLDREKLASSFAPKATVKISKAGSVGKRGIQELPHIGRTS